MLKTLPLVVLRISVALILGVHPYSRLLRGHVPGFGEYFASQGFPAPEAVAWFVTLAEAAAILGLLSGKFIRFAVPIHLAVLITGIVMVHGPEGWFVVGGGRNGVEFSALLICCLVTLFIADWQDRKQAKWVSTGST